MFGCQLAFCISYAFISRERKLVKIIVADRKGIVSSAVRSAFERMKNPTVQVVRVSSWSQVLRAMGDQKSAVLLSAQLIQGFASTTSLAKSIKELNREVIFIAYNGLNEDYGEDVDYAIPAFEKVPEVGNYGDWIAEFILRNAMKGEDRTRQMALF